MKLTIDPPSIERVFQSLVDGAGYHDAESIPTADVFKMFRAFFDWEHKRSDELQKLVAEMQVLYPRPQIISTASPENNAPK